MEVEAPPPNTPVAGKFLSVRSVGLTVTDVDGSSGLVVGYSDQSFATLRDGTLVDGHPLRPMERTEGIYNTLEKARALPARDAAAPPAQKIQKKRAKKKHARRHRRR